MCYSRLRCSSLLRANLSIFCRRCLSSRTTGRSMNSRRVLVAVEYCPLAMRWPFLSLVCRSIPTKNTTSVGSRILQRSPKTDVSEALRLIGHTNHELLAAVVGRSKKFSLPKYLRQYLDCRMQTPTPQLETGVWIPFLKVITHPQAVFSEENALLHLARCLATELPKGGLKCLTRVEN